MGYEEKNYAAAPHHIMLEDRHALTVSGVEEVESFDDASVVLRCSLGRLIVRGSELMIEQLSLNGGDLRVAGMVDSLSYEELPQARGGGLLARLFR